MVCGIMMAISRASLLAGERLNVRLCTPTDSIKLANTGSSTSRPLREVKIPIVDHGKCEAAYTDNVKGEQFNTSLQLCGGLASHSLNDAIGPCRVHFFKVS